MAATIPVEVETGTYSGPVNHPHNGYYAADFSSSRSGREEPRNPPINRVPL